MISASPRSTPTSRPAARGASRRADRTGQPGSSEERGALSLSLHIGGSNMRRSRLSLLPVGSLRLAGLAACLALSAGCGEKPDAKDAGTGQDSTVAGATDAGGKPLVAIIRAADWMGREWSEDA